MAGFHLHPRRRLLPGLGGHCSTRDAINLEGYHWGPRMSVVGLTINAVGGHGDNHLLPPTPASAPTECAIICGADQARQAKDQLQSTAQTASSSCPPTAS